VYPCFAVTIQGDRVTGPLPTRPAQSTPTTAVTGRHLPSLDGLRAFAVGGVVAYHLGWGFASGGFLGVDLFFVLSGFLITTLLLEEWISSGTIRLGAFWGRRARRLLPGLVLLLVCLGLFVVLDGRFGGPGATAGIDFHGLRDDALAALFYVANWHFIFEHQSYWAQFSAPSPLQHTWSLAIEEQFYLVWPPLLLLILPRLRVHWRKWLSALAVVGGLASVVAMAALYQNGNPNRAYLGTDTRIFDMLAGAVVAAVAAGRSQPGPVARRALHLSAGACAVVLAIFWATAGSANGVPKPWMFRGGFAVCAILAAIVIADVRQFRSGPLGRVLALRPLRWIGMISYGIYLWHWPVIVYLNPARTGLTGWVLDVVRIVVMVAAAAASFYLVERPIRRMRFTTPVRRALVPVGIATAAAVVVVATIPALSIPTGATPAAAAVQPTSLRSVPGSGGFGKERPIKLPTARHVSPGDPLRILLLGDSVMETAEPAITAALDSTGDVHVFDDAFPGWGLINDTGWRQGLPALVEQDRPDLVIAMWGWDDTEAQEHPEAYKTLLEQALQTLTTPGSGVAGVMLLQYPPMGGGPDSDYTVQRQREEGDAAWERIAAEMPKTYPGQVMYLPLSRAIAPKGKFTAWLPPATRPKAPRSEWVRVRMIDTVHFCPAGAARYAQALLTDLTEVYHLPAPRPGWSSGTWTQDQSYRNTPGACPDDHP